MNVLPFPKPRKRHVATPREWAKLRRIIGVGAVSCFCGCGRRSDSAAHIVPRGLGGDDVLENLIPLAGDGTSLCHGAQENGQRVYDVARRTYIEPGEVRARIRARLLPEHLAYVEQRKGRGWLDRYFPEAA